MSREIHPTVDTDPCSVCTRPTLIDGNVTWCGELVCGMCAHECGECDAVYAQRRSAS